MKKPCAILFLGAVVLGLLAGPAAFADEDKVIIDIGGAQSKQFSIIVSSSSKSNPAIGRKIVEIIASDLRFAALFDVKEMPVFPYDFSTLDSAFTEWSGKRAEGAVLLEATSSGSTLKVKLAFYDPIVGAKPLIEPVIYSGHTDDVRMIAHKFSDILYKKVTNREGIFQSKIAFSARRKGGVSKEIYVSDYDGGNLFKLTEFRSISMTPQWSSDYSGLYFTSFRRRNSDLYFWDRVRGNFLPVSTHSGINTGGAESPKNPRTVALSISKGTNSDIYLVDKYSGAIVRRLTDYWGIDVSPTWSPDAGKLAFSSDRSGTPHIFVLDLEGSASPRRLTFSGTNNLSPVWSPSGQTIAFSGYDANRTFQIFVIGADGARKRQLTHGGRDALKPSWSPDGSYLLYESASSDGASHLVYVDLAGNERGRVKLDGLVIGEPSWSPRTK